MFAEVRNICDGGLLQEDKRVSARAAEDDETGEEEEPREAVLPGVRQALYRREAVHVQPTDWSGGGTVLYCQY